MNLKKTSIKLIPIIKLLCLVLCLTHTSEATRCPSKQNSPMANAGKKIYRVAVPCLALLRGDIVGAVSSALLIHGFYTTNTLLENRIGKKRPCGCDGAFPSGHTIVMGTGSSYLMFRYGWRFGLPPMILAFILLSDRVASPNDLSIYSPFRSGCL